MSGGRTSQQVQLIQDFRPDVILCTPSYLLTIVDAMIAAGVDPRSTSLKAGVLGAEPWTNQMRAELEERLDIDALDIYGLSEVMGPGVANECIESKDGPHVWEDHFLPEIIDEETGQSLPDGNRGELVLTSLTKQAFPVIRYRTRDLTTLLPGTARPSMRRIEKITGRDDDMIILRGVNLFPTQIEEIVLGVNGLSPHFVLELSRPARLDELTVRVERRTDADGTRLRTGQRGTDPAGEERDRLHRARGDRRARHAGTQHRETQASLRPPVAATMPETSEPAPSARRRGRPGYDQQAVLEIAVAAFNEFGYDATSMGMLASRLGLSKSAIYHHFASKEELLQVALDVALTGLEEILTREQARSGPRPTGSTSSCAAPSRCW